MSYATLRPAALEWDAIQETRIKLNNMIRGFERHGRSVPPWLDYDGPQDDQGFPPRGLLQVLEYNERAAVRAVCRAMEGEPWLVRVRDFVESMPGLGPAIFCIVGLLPPLIAFANPAKLWKYLGLHVLTDQKTADTHPGAVGGRAPKRPTCGPGCTKADCPHDRWSFRLKAYAITRVVGPIGQSRHTEKAIASALTREVRLAPESPYLAVLDARDAHTQGTHPEWALERNQKGQLVPKLHYKRDAERYTVKRVWRDLWRAAHGQTVPDTQRTDADAAPTENGSQTSNVTQGAGAAVHSPGEEAV